MTHLVDGHCFVISVRRSILRFACTKVHNGHLNGAFKGLRICRRFHLYHISSMHSRQTSDLYVRKLFSEFLHFVDRERFIEALKHKDQKINSVLMEARKY